MRRKFNRTVPLNSRCYFIPILFNLTEVVSVISACQSADSRIVMGVESKMKWEAVLLRDSGHRLGTMQLAALFTRINNVVFS